MSFWETARRILSGKPKGAKLIVLGVFLESVTAGLWIYSPGNFAVAAFFLMGIWAFTRGLDLYQQEVRSVGKGKKTEEESST